MTRSVDPKHPTQIDKLLDIMARLRDPDGGCPWDIEQTFSTIAPYTIEEAYEVADAIDRDAMDDLKDELGDLLFQVVYHAQMASEGGHFLFSDVVAAICEKMTRRHPHVFGEADMRTAEEQTEAWEQIKADERAQKANVPEGSSLLANIPVGLPSLLRAIKLQKKAARAGFDWETPAPVFEKVSEELSELAEAVSSDAELSRVEEELGDLLFSCVNLARHLGVEPERALRYSNNKFQRRFDGMAAVVAASGGSLQTASAAELDAFWEGEKAREGGSDK